MSRLKSAEFTIASRGLASSFPASNTPKEYSDGFRNLYINNTGNAELRQGLSSHSRVDTANTITQLHEFVDAKGTEVLFASGGGRIWLYAASSDSWAQVFSFPAPISSSPIIYSYDMNDRIIFYDGVNRSVYTTDGVSFHEQKSLLEAGRASIGTSAGALVDTTVTNWVTTDVVQYDMVLYTELSAYGLVTSVLSAHVNHTPVSASSGGIGISPTGQPAASDAYQIIDMVELNIIPIAGQDPDNMGVLASGSSSTSIRLSAIPDFTTTLVRKGDVVYNSTLNRVTQVTAVTTGALGVAGIDSQAAGNEVVLLKSSMPIVRAAHVHFSRSYLADAREPHKIRISGPNNSQDLGGGGASTLDVSTLQPTGEVIKSLHSFQRFFIIGGSRTIYFYEGTVPAASSSGGETVDFAIRGSFPIGVLSHGSVSNIGNDCVFVSNAGIQASSLQKSSDQLVITQSSRQLDRTLRSLLRNVDESQIILFHYPRRSWMCVKVGTELYIYNYSVAQGSRYVDQSSPTSEASTVAIDPDKVAWHIFDQRLAQQKCFLVRTNGDLMTGNVQGQVNIFDQDVYTDLGDPISVEYRTSWNTFSAERVRVLPKISRKQGKAITPFFEAGASIPVAINAVAGFDKTSSDEVIVTADSAGGVIGVAEIGQWVIGGSDVTNKKFPLRWNGSEAQFSFVASVSAGPFQLTGFVVHYTDGDAA